jgi:cytidylate kinase
MIITIDGPAGSGKSTAARKLAAVLEIPYLDTGAMYRAITLNALQKDVSLNDPDALVRLATETEIKLDCGPTHVRVIMDGHDVSEAIRSMHVSEHTTKVARTAGVRKVLVSKQREIGRHLGSLVTEGRDQGSVVFPDADVKFFVDADDTKRAERRYHEMAADGEDVDFEAVLENIRNRDEKDRAEWEQLLSDKGTIRIDTSAMTIREVVDYMQQEVEKRCR